MTEKAYDKALVFFETELQKNILGQGQYKQCILSAFIKVKQGKEKEAVALFEKQKNDGKGKTAKRIKGELFGLRNKKFLNELLQTLAPFGLPQE